MEIIRQAFTSVGMEFFLNFPFNGKEESGYSFPCDSDGVVTSSLNPTARENLRKCLDGTYDVAKPTLEKREWRNRHPRIGRCECGAGVALQNFTNPCECGRDYNMGGQLLAPRECWGEETGEHWTECL